MKSQVPNKGKEVVKSTFVLSLPPPILAKSMKEIKEISKYFKKNDKPLTKKSYAQASLSKQAFVASSLNITMNTLKIKETFSHLSNKKINMIQKVINGSDDKPKLKIIMTTKGLSQKQVIMPMNKDLSKRFTKNTSTHVININCSLKNIYSNTIADFICADNKGVIITTNNIASNSDLQEIEKYIKNSLSDNKDSIASARLPQSKSYLKIVGIPYFVDNSNTCISSENIEHILKNNHIFNNIVLTSKLCIIKVSPKSNMVIVWIDIWNTQRGSNARKIINRRFNIGNIIVMVKGANMNPDVSQCKNCWKWSHTAGVCCIQGSKCAKCNGPHLTEHHCDFAWCCKANNKINPPRLETKKDEPCPHSFKCLNCKGSHLTNSNDCLFWKHHFNKEWHTKEYAKLQEARKNSIHSSINDNEL